MENQPGLSERLAKKLNEICDNRSLVKGIMLRLRTDEERQFILDIAEAGGEEATPKNLAYAAINIEDERKSVR